VTLTVELTPRGPYSLALSARHASDATRRFAERRLDSLVRVAGGLERTLAWQRPDGTVVIRAESEEAVEAVRFQLALDDDHTPFLERFRDDHLLREPLRRLRGLRPLRVATVAQSLLRAVCGQLITAREARQIERRVIRGITPRHEASGFHAAPTSRELGELSPARLRQLGLGSRRGSALVRVCRGVDLERWRGAPTAAIVQRVCREAGLGPWSAGVVALEGLGRYEHGLVGDLGLVKMCSALWARPVDGEETAALLAPYEEWQGLASVYLLAGRAFVPVTPLHAAA
jgi:AraC family transcriptional regulator of adaptative response / DNA-3-methyladenine glycosylase II